MWMRKKVQVFQCCCIFPICNAAFSKAFVVEEANHVFGESLRSDLELQTSLRVCCLQRVEECW
jgi:hypothetical protein